MPRSVADRSAVAVYFNAFTGYRVVLESRTTRILVQEAVISGAYWRPCASHPRRGAGNLFEGEISTKFSRDVGQPLYHFFGCVCVRLFVFACACVEDGPARRKISRVPKVRSSGLDPSAILRFRWRIVRLPLQDAI